MDKICNAHVQFTKDIRELSGIVTILSSDIKWIRWLIHGFATVSFIVVLPIFITFIFQTGKVYSSVQNNKSEIAEVKTHMENVEVMQHMILEEVEK